MNFKGKVWASILLRFRFVRVNFNCVFFFEKRISFNTAIAFPENDDDGEIISFPDLLPNNLCDIDSTVNNNSSHTTAKTTQSLSVYHHAVVRSINTSKGDLGYHLKLRERKLKAMDVLISPVVV